MDTQQTLKENQADSNRLPSTVKTVLFKDVKNMGVGEFINESRRILKLATKPSRKELWLATRVSLLAMVLVGMVSFIIQIIMTLITGNWGVITS